MIRATAIALGIATLLLVVWGGAVHATGSGLACGDHWPLCYEVARAARGESVVPTLAPRMEGGVAVEHGHRVFAALVGLGTIAFVVLAFRRSDLRLRAWAVASLCLVVAQGLLGAVTVRLRLPGLVSTGHLCLSMAFLGTMIFLGFRARAAEARESLARRAAVVPLVAVCVEIVLGAVVRHTGAGPVCAAQFPMCNGEWIPAGAQALTHLAHRLVAVVVLVAVTWGALRAAKVARSGGRPTARRLAVAAPALVTMQVGLGIATVVTGIRPVVATMHLAVGALLFVDLLALVLCLGPLGAPALPATGPAARASSAISPPSGALPSMGARA